MSAEIKEILEYYRKYMSIKDCIKLSKIEDYITNLEQENKKLKDELDKEHYEYQEALEISYSNWCNERKRIKELEDRNEEHKEINGKLRVELEDLEKRINKAIKYIYELDINIVIKNTLKVILTHKGGD